MSLFNGGEFSLWLPPNTQRKLQEARDRILTTDDLQSLWREILTLSLVLFFSAQEDAACQILEAYLNVYPVHRNGQALVWAASKERVREKQVLELMLDHSTSRPANFPWVSPTSGNLEWEQQFDIANAAFFKLNRWTETEWIPRTDYGKRANFVPIDENYDPHQWKTSDDPWTHAICARLLCHVPEEGRETPSRAAVEETFEAVDKLFTQLPRRRNPANPSDEWPHSHVFPVKIYFLLAVNLDMREKAKEIIELAISMEEFSLHDLVDVPAIYEITLASDLQTSSRSRMFSPERTANALSILKEALIERHKTGQQELLQGVEWPELLRRFSEAAFRVENDSYQKLDDPPEKPSDILFPPITPEALAEVEAKIGPLPPDVKDMVLIANGFKGGWHFAGGGFGGVEYLYREPAGEYETYLDVEPVVQCVPQTVTNPDGTTRTVMMNVISIPGSETGIDWGPVYGGPGAVENDGFYHIICPPETWKKIKGGDVKEGEYKILYYASWTAGPRGEYSSMRDWITEMTVEMERELGSLEEP